MTNEIAKRCASRAGGALSSAISFTSRVKAFAVSGACYSKMMPGLYQAKSRLPRVLVVNLQLRVGQPRGPQWRGRRKEGRTGSRKLFERRALRSSHRSIKSVQPTAKRKFVLRCIHRRQVRPRAKVGRLEYFGDDGAALRLYFFKQRNRGKRYNSN